MDIVELLAYVVKVHASDLHLSAGLPPMVRVHGDVRRLNHPALQHSEVHAMLYDIMNDSQRKMYEESLECDFSFEVPNLARFRVNALVEKRGAGAVMRVVPTKVSTLEELGAPAVFRSIAENARGLVLVTGPTGSGKSTTLAAMIDYINATEPMHILTIEDPIEFVHESKKSLVRQRELGPHTLSFANALRSALREDPDVILVGEMRDQVTISLALTAAETGHLVFGTLHTTTAYSTIDRIIDQYPPDQQEQIRVMLSESLKGVVSQTLCKKIGGGRVAALEVLLVNPAVSNLIREGKTFQIPSIMQTAKNVGMRLMTEALADLVGSNQVTAEEAMSKAVDKTGLAVALKSRGLE